LSTTVRWIAGALLAAMMMVMVFAQDASAAPAFQAAGTAVGAPATISASPAWPAHLIGDIALLFVETCGNQPATLSVPATFAAVLNSPQATGTCSAGTGTQLTVFWARATSTSMSAP